MNILTTQNEKSLGTHLCNLTTCDFYKEFRPYMERLNVYTYIEKAEKTISKKKKEANLAFNMQMLKDYSIDFDYVGKSLSMGVSVDIGNCRKIKFLADRNVIIYEKTRYVANVYSFILLIDCIKSNKSINFYNVPNTAIRKKAVSEKAVSENPTKKSSYVARGKEFRKLIYLIVRDKLNKLGVMFTENPEKNSFSFSINNKEKITYLPYKLSEQIIIGKARYNGDFDYLISVIKDNLNIIREPNQLNKEDASLGTNVNKLNELLGYSLSDAISGYELKTHLYNELKRNSVSYKMVGIDAIELVYKSGVKYFYDFKNKQVTVNKITFNLEFKDLMKIQKHETAKTDSVFNEFVTKVSIDRQHEIFKEFINTLSVEDIERFNEMVLAELRGDEV